MRRIVIGARSTHFCTWCQRLPAGEKAGAAAILRGMEPRLGQAPVDPHGPALDRDRWRGRLARHADGIHAARGRVVVRGQGVARRANQACGGNAARGGAGGIGRSPGFERLRLGRERGRLMSILRLEGVHREVGTFVILDRIDAAIALGDRVGLVGPNGAGKTTLMRIAAGQDEPDEGKVSRKRELSIGMLAQEAHLDEKFMTAPDVRSAVRHGASHLEAMAVELEVLEHAHRATEPAYEALQHRFEGLGGYTLDQRVDEALSGLGFSIADMARPPSSLSGGEQTRATLARLVIAAPDLLLLDEPTNHLDLGALEWLEDHLRRRHGSLLVASHDRAFLDATVNRIWELRDRKLTVFRGDYSLVPPPA